MEPLRGCYRLAALSLIAFFCSTTPLDAQQPPREQPRFGGVLKIAMIAEPPSLNPYGSASVSITYTIMRHVFETLYAMDKDWSPTPHLAEGHTVSNGGRQYTLTLRKGVRFHNGKEMTAFDVVASLNRIQVLFYEDVGRIKFGDLFTLAAVRKELRGDFRSFPASYFWNAWLEKK